MRYDTKNKTWEKNLISVETVTESSEQIITLKKYVVFIECTTSENFY